MPFEDLKHIRSLRRSQAALFENITRAAEAKRVVIYSMDPWQLGVVDQFLHLAFQRRGHAPVSIYYDGLLPLTAWENAATPPPTVDSLKQRAEAIYEAFGIAPRGISRYVDKTAVTESARTLIDSADDAALPHLTHRGIPVGEIALRDLFQYTLGHFEPTTPDDFALYRRHLIHAVMSVDLAHAILDAERPDIVVLVNGKSVMYSYMYEVARHRGVSVTTWEEGMFDDNGIVFANDAPAINFPIADDDWAAARNEPLPPGRAEEVERFFTRWRNQEAIWHTFYENEERDFDRIRTTLSIPPGKRIVSIFANIVWDTNALGRDDAFDGMMDWIYETIDLIAPRSGDVLIIRAHPGESRWEYKTRTPVRAMVESRCGGRLPANVRIVDGESDLSSYTMAAHSDRCAVYTSTLGVELSLAGLRPLICGVPFYGRKGFTHDVTSIDDYAACLTGGRSPRPTDRDALLRFMSLVLYRFIKRPEFLNGIHGHPQRPRIRIETFDGFPESMPIFNEVVDCILERRSFVAESCPEEFACQAQT